MSGFSVISLGAALVVLPRQHPLAKALPELALVRGLLSCCCRRRYCSVAPGLFFSRSTCSRVGASPSLIARSVDLV